MFSRRLQGCTGLLQSLSAVDVIFKVFSCPLPMSASLPPVLSFKSPEQDGALLAASALPPEEHHHCRHLSGRNPGGHRVVAARVDQEETAIVSGS